MVYKCNKKKPRLNTSAPLEAYNLKQRLEKKFNKVNNFTNSVNNNKEMITNFKDKNHKSK